MCMRADEGIATVHSSSINCFSSKSSAFAYAFSTTLLENLDGLGTWRCQSAHEIHHTERVQRSRSTDLLCFSISSGSLCSVDRLFRQARDITIPKYTDDHNVRVLLYFYIYVPLRVHKSRGGRRGKVINSREGFAFLVQHKTRCRTIGMHTRGTNTCVTHVFYTRVGFLFRFVPSAGVNGRGTWRDGYKTFLVQSRKSSASCNTPHTYVLDWQQCIFIRADMDFSFFGRKNVFFSVHFRQTLCFSN